jgi:flagellar motility protein MotE (MotC chaperone)
MKHILLQLPVLAAGIISAVTVAFAQAQPPDESAAEIQQTIVDYCGTITDAAAERRMANQTAALKNLETRVQAKVDKLENAKNEVEALLKRREELRNLARKELVEIYAGMDSEAAARQLEKLDLLLASSLLRQLKPRQASAILNEISPELAARMAKVIASAAKNEKEQP